MICCKKIVQPGILCILLFFFCPSLLSAARIRPLAISNPGGFIGFSWEREDNTRENQSTGEPVKDDDRSLTENFGFGMDGYIYHPRFIEFTTDGEWVFKQETESGTFAGGAAQDLQDNFTNYAVTLNLLKAHRFSFHFRSSRVTQETNSSFFESQRNRIDTNGGFLTYRNRILPTLIGYEKTKSKGEGQDTSDNRFDKFFVQMSNSGEYGKSDLKYEKEDKFQRSGNIDLQSNLLRFNNFYHFGNKKKHNLASFYRWREQTGTFSIREATMAENLTLRHTDSLSSYYSYHYDDVKLKDQVSTTYQYTTGLKHKLYDSLTTALEGNVNRFRVDSGTRDTVYGELSFNYNKTIPWGRLNLNYRTQVQNDDENFSGTSIPITGEEHSFLPSNPEGEDVIVLNQQAVFDETIVLKDENDLFFTDPFTGLPIEEGIHYRVETVGSITKIRVLLPGRPILAPSPVSSRPTIFIDYEFEPSPAIKFRTVTHAFGGVLQIKRLWKIFYQRNRTDETLQSGLDTGRLDDVINRTYGTEITWKNTTSRVERNQYRSRLNPYDRQSFTEALLFRLGKSRTYRPVLRLDAGYATTTTLPTTPRSISRTASAQLYIPFPNKMTWDSLLRYLNIDQVGEKEKSLAFTSEIRWTYRKLEIRFSYENLHRRQEITGNETRQRIFLKVERFFGRKR